MKVSRAKLGFLSVLAAGVIGLAATLAFTPSQTYGLETDTSGSGAAANPASAGGSGSGAAGGNVGGGAQALPPQAPVEGPSAGVGGGATQLPSAGSGGYLGQGAVSWAQVALFAAFAVAGSGSLIWAFGRKRR